MKEEWPDLKCSVGIFLGEMRKITKYFFNKRNPGRDLSPGPAEYESELLPTRRYISFIVYLTTLQYRDYTRKASDGAMIDEW
jgi:hypothetical protein